MLKTDNKHLTVEAYFELAETAQGRIEYCNGEVFAMGGASLNHNRITINISSLLNARFKGGPSEVFAGDLRVQIEKDRHYLYPDIVVVCNGLDLMEGRFDTIVNPAVIMEVLSDSTKDYDRGSKFTPYRTIPTLTDYILIDQEAVHIEYFSRESRGVWRLRELFDMDGVLAIGSIDTILLISEIYDRVRMPGMDRS